MKNVLSEINPKIIAEFGITQAYVKRNKFYYKADKYLPMWVLTE